MLGTVVLAVEALEQLIVVLVVKTVKQHQLASHKLNAIRLLHLVVRIRKYRLLILQHQSWVLSPLIVWVGSVELLRHRVVIRMEQTL
jgi:hypothetical protein